MQLRIPLTDLYAAPGFLDPSGDAAPMLDAARVATLYTFLPADTAFTLSEGVRDKEYDLTVVHRAEVFLLGVRIDEEGTSMAPVILQAISQDWLRQHFAWIVADMRPGDVLAELVDGKTGRRGIEQPM